jgi:hypothetical protein
MKYNLVSSGNDSNITIFTAGGEMFTANSEHPNWEAIVSGVLAGDESVANLFNVVKSIETNFNKVSERVSVLNGRVYFDGEEIDNALSKQILRFMNEGVEDWKPLVAFFEKIATNPLEHSREQLYRWLETHDFTITPDGDIVGYKGVRALSDGTYTSISQGPAIVDGKPVNGAVPNAIGSVVEMPRSQVAHDPNVACHTGLHVGTWEYARDFAQGAVLEVHVNPRDVVSVPVDCHSQKVRTCRYTVVGVLQDNYKTSVLEHDSEDDDEFDDDTLHGPMDCDYC